MFQIESPSKVGARKSCSSVSHCRGRQLHPQRQLLVVQLVEEDVVTHPPGEKICYPRPPSRSAHLLLDDAALGLARLLIGGGRPDLPEGQARRPGAGGRAGDQRRAGQRSHLEFCAGRVAGLREPALVPSSS